MAGAASAHQAATASREQTSHQRAVRTRRSSADPQRAQQGATAAAADAPAALQALSRLQQLANASPQVAQLRRLQGLADNRFAPVAQLAGGPEEEELVQGKFASAELQPLLQQAPRANNTGLPDQLKSGIESLSGLSMDHVRVHYNSSQPAQLNALAYAQGSDIHLAPGQERHLPHEAWHVVQQAQGRVMPTLQINEGVPVNDDVGLEREADVMGYKALEAGHRADVTHRSVSMPIEATKQVVGDATNSPDLKVANNDSAALANVRGSAQRGGNEVQRIADQCPEAALQRWMHVQVWGDESERVGQLRAWQATPDVMGVKALDAQKRVDDHVNNLATTAKHSAPVQRTLIIGGQKFTDKDAIRKTAFATPGATDAAIERLVNVGIDPKLDATFANWEDAVAQYDHAPIGDPLAFAHDADKDKVQIPPLIHFIWMGKPPSHGAIQNILRWAKRAQNTDWCIKLWTDGIIQTGNWEPQLAQLHGYVEVRQIQDVLDERLVNYYNATVGQQPRAFNMASDMARYSILQRYGGVYVDVDLGPGDVDLTKVPMLSAVEIPITAPQVRDRQALNEQLTTDELASLDLPDKARIAATRAYIHNQLNNNLLISGRNSTYMEALIQNVATRMDREQSQGQGDRSNWAENAALITGPQAVIKTMFQHLGVEIDKLIDHMDQDTLANWSTLEWLTDESENQTYDTSATDKNVALSSKTKSCFLTTVCVEALGRPDNCYELTTLRAFRDGYMRSQPEGNALVREYYEIAPKIVHSLRRDPHFQERAAMLYERLVVRSIRLIEAGREREALDHYRAITLQLYREVMTDKASGAKAEGS